MGRVEQGPGKLFHYAYGADQDLICIMGGTSAGILTFDWIPDEHGHFGVRMRDPNKKEIPRSVKKTWGFDLGRATLS